MDTRISGLCSGRPANGALLHTRIEVEYLPYRRSCSLNTGRLFLLLSFVPLQASSGAWLRSTLYGKPDTTDHHESFPVLLAIYARRYIPRAEES
jgi:hypothetical protein